MSVLSGNRISGACPVPFAWSILSLLFHPTAVSVFYDETDSLDERYIRIQVFGQYKVCILIGKLKLLKFRVMFERYVLIPGNYCSV